MSDGSSDLRLLQQCCCRVVVLPGLDPPGRTGRVPPHSPAEEMEIRLIQLNCLLTNEKVKQGHNRSNRKHCIKNQPPREVEC